MAKLSVVISAYNDEKKIEDCLKSVKHADEIIVVDNTSSDKTVEIAKKYTSKIYSRPNNPMLNINKNFGFTKATNDWILSLDTDERVSEELAKEIKSEIRSASWQTKSEINGYWIPRKNIIFNKWIQHTGWYPDYQLRLFRKDKGRFEEKHVHEMIKINGKTKYLKEDIIHYNYDTIKHFLKKLGDIYAPNEAAYLLENGYQFRWQDAVVFPAKEFLSRFFAREGYKDGFYGLMLSILMGFYHFIVFANIWEELKFKEPEEKNLLNATEKEINKIYRELFFWINHEKIKFTKNPLKKILHRLLFKLRNI